jgi:hypothetical protein
MDIDITASVVEGILKFATAIMERLPKKERAAVQKRLDSLVRPATDAEIKEYDPKVKALSAKFGAPKRRTMSAAARKRISAAQKKRWATIKQKQTKRKKRAAPKKKMR